MKSNLDKPLIINYFIYLNEVLIYKYKGIEFNISQIGLCPLALTSCISMNIPLNIVQLIAIAYCKMYYILHIGNKRVTFITS